MNNKCEYYNKCNKISDYKKGLEGENKEELNYVLTTCLEGGKDTCIKEQKSLDKKLEEDSNG